MRGFVKTSWRQEVEARRRRRLHALATALGTLAGATGATLIARALGW